jgi:hypothetical protein
MHPAQLVCVVVFAGAVASSCLIQEVVRSQLVSRLDGNPQVGWRDLRHIGDWFGQGGMWSLHERYYPACRLRLWFVVSLVAMALAAIVGGLLQAYGVR